MAGNPGPSLILWAVVRPDGAIVESSISQKASGALLGFVHWPAFFELGYRLARFDGRILGGQKSGSGEPPCQPAR